MPFFVPEQNRNLLLIMEIIRYTPMSKKRLQTLSDLRRYMANLLNRYEAEEIDERHLKAGAYVCNVMAGIIKDDDLDKRITKLENEVRDGAFRHAS